MQRLEWHCHTKSVSRALYKAILYHGQSAGKEMANSAVFNFRRNTGSAWISLTKLEGNSRHATQQPETHDHQWWLDVSVVRRVSTSKQTGDDDVLVHQPSTEVSTSSSRRSGVINQSINRNFKWTNAKALQSLYINMGRYYVSGNDSEKGKF